MSIVCVHLVSFSLSRERKRDSRAAADEVILRERTNLRKIPMELAGRARARARRDLWQSN